MTLFRHFTPAALAGLALCAAIFHPAPCLAQSTSFTISTICGSTAATPGYSGDGVAAKEAELNEPIGLAFDSQGNLYIADSANERIREIYSPVTSGKITTVAGDGSQLWVGDDLKATGVSLNSPYGVRIDSAGNVYISDTADDEVRLVTVSNGIINDFAGLVTNYGYCSNATCSENGIPATQAYVDNPVGLAIDKAGNVYIADSGNDRIRVVNPSGMISTFAGNNQYNNPPGKVPWSSYGGDGGPATEATLYNPSGISLDGAGNLYIADRDDNCIRKVDTSGIITTVAGQCAVAGAFSGDGGPATSAKLNSPWDVLATAGGDLYISDYYNNVVRMVSGVTGIITTVAGKPGVGTGYTGDGGAATSALFNHPTGLAMDTNGNIYVADSDNNVVRMLTPTAPTIDHIISASGYGCGVAGATQCGFTSIAPGSWIEIYGPPTPSEAGNLAIDGRSWQTSDFQGTAAPTNLDGTTVTVGGQPAYISFISGGQVNALVPSNVGTGQQTVVVTTKAGSASFNINVNPVEPGLLSPSTWNFGGTQYAVAQLNGTATLILPPGTVPGLATQRAQPGQTIVLYGIGFGPVSPAVPDGQPAGADNLLAGSLQISIGGVQAQVTYDGLAATYYGLYAFGVVVPSNLPANDKTPVTFSLNGANGAQTLYLAVQ